MASRLKIATLTRLGNIAWPDFYIITNVSRKRNRVAILEINKVQTISIDDALDSKKWRLNDEAKRILARSVHNESTALRRKSAPK